MKKLFTLFTAMISFLLTAQNTDFYVASHPDDWQLFMNPNAYKSVKTDGNKVVFIHTTAGDAGRGISDNYYLAREEGSLRAIRFLSNTHTSGLGTNMNKQIVNIDGHNILKYSYRNIVAYFLRLPDGGMDGSGVPLGSPSLKKLYDGLQNINAIDGSTTYTSVDDLKAVIKNIVDIESQGNSISFNIADTNENNNPSDHSDHIYSSKIIQDIAPLYINKSVKLNLYVEYYSNNLNKNVSDDDFLINAGTWGATTSGLADNGQNSTWDSNHNPWVSRQYFRTESKVQEENLALNKPTTSSSNENGSQSSAANDGNNNSYWGASPYSQWWQVDLKANYKLNKLNVINYYDGNRYYQYDILGSKDGINWTQLVNFSNNTIPSNSSGNTFTLSDATARYLRVNMKYNSANTGVHINEFKAYGTLANTPLNKVSKSDVSNQKKKISIYPNPVKEGSTLKFDIPLMDDTNVNIKIYNLNSIELYNQNSFLKKNSILEIPIQNLKKGIYLIKVKSPNIDQSNKIIIE